MPRKLLTISLARVRLGRASREAESPSGGHGQSTSSKGFLLSKGNWNKSNERKIHFHGLIRNSANCIKYTFIPQYELAQSVFLGSKSFCIYCINCIFFVLFCTFFAKRYTIICYFYLRNCIFFAIIVLSLKRSTI